MEQQKNVPAIRFKGFQEEWVEKKLKEFSSYKASNISVSHTKIHGSYKVYDANQCIGYTDKYIMKDDYITIIKDGSGVGRVRKLEGNTSFIATMGGIMNDNSDLNFLYNILLKTDFSKHITGATIPHIYYSVYGNDEYLIPNTSEQSQIGNFFKTLDGQINAQEQKHQKLVNLKKAMLEKMFPKEGADVPEIRFNGFTEKWKHIELCEVLNQRKVIQKISIDAPILAFAAGQGVIDRSERKSNNRDHLTKDESNKKYLLTELNDIVYNPSNLKYGAIDRNKHGKGVISPIYVTFTTEEFPSFIELIVKDENFKIKALQYEEGTVVKRQSVKPENLLSLKVFVSNSLEEQEKIGEYFEKLDNLIQKSQVQIGKYKNIKQALLQKMFV